MSTYPAATWRPGPRSKTGYPGAISNTGGGVILHSMVGSYAAAMGRLDSEDRASWHFSVCQDGRVFQHYDSSAVCWHAGSLQWNERLIGIEHEGGAPGNESEPLTDVQKVASAQLVAWLAQTHGFALERQNGLWEHREVYQTACPSGRIPWAFIMEGEMTDAQMQELKDYIDGKFQTQQNWITMRFVALIGWLVANFPKPPG